MGHKLEVHLLGGLSIRQDRELLNEFSSSKEPALFAYLVCTRKSYPREVLAELFWPERPPEQSRSNLRTLLSRIRRTALGDYLHITRSEVALNTERDYWLDVAEFQAQLTAIKARLGGSQRLSRLDAEQLDQTLRLYQGEFLAGFYVGDSYAFEEWVSLQREALHRDAVEALRLLVAYDLDAGRCAAAIAHVTRLLALAPLDEAAHRQLMRALAISGRRSAALAQYETCRDRLREELGVDLEAETLALYEQIRSGVLGSAVAEGAGGEPENPYKGLLAFEEVDAANFFGREALVAQLLARLRAGTTAAQAQREDAERFLAIVGPSGSGKSSVVKAGLIPALRQVAQVTGEPWYFATMQPGRDPLAALAAALDRALPPSSRGMEDLLAHLRRAAAEPQAQAEALMHILEARLPPDAILFLFIDQAEELFTLVQDLERRAQFTTLLLSALRAHASPLQLITTLRADYYAQPLLTAGWAELFTQAVAFTLPLSPEELRQAIVAPAARVGVAIEPALVATLVADAGQAPGALPLLQYTLTELFERREGTIITLAAYEALGGLQGALANRTEVLYAELHEVEREAARQVFLHLIVPGEGAADTRRRVAYEALLSLATSPWRAVPAGEPASPGESERRRALQAVLGAFGRYHLLTFDQDLVRGVPTVEIAHEALIGEWERLRDWLHASRQGMYRHRRLADLTMAWEQAGRDASFLSRGRQLAEFEAWMATTDLSLTESEVAYLTASLARREALREQESVREAREAELERRDQQRRRALNWVLAVATVIALLLAGYAFAQRQSALENQRLAEREAAVAQSLNLATSARLALAEYDTDLALALALAANQDPNPPPQALFILSEAAYAPGVRRVFRGHEGPVQSVAVSADGRTLLSGSADQTLILWDLESGEIIRSLSGHTGTVHSGVFLNNGRHALSASADGSLILWDLETGESLRQFTGHQGPIYDIALHPTEPWALSASADQSLILWDLESGEIVRQFTGHTGAVTSVAIHHEGLLAISGSTDRSVIIWDVASGEVLHHMVGHTQHELDPAKRTGHFDVVWDVTFARNSRTAMSVSQDTFVMQWNIDTGELIRWYQPPPAAMLSVAISPDDAGTLVSTADSRIALMTLYFGQTVLELHGHSGRVMDVAFSPDAQFVVSGGEDGTVRLWALNSGAQRRRFVVDPYSAIELSLSPDGKRALSASFGGYVMLWDTGSGEVTQRFTGHKEGAYAGALLRPDGQTAISGGGSTRGECHDPVLRLWNIETGEELRSFEGHTDFLWDIALSPDGRIAVTGANDGTVRRWDLETGDSAVLLDIAPQSVRGVALSPDGQLMLATPGEGTSDPPDYALYLVDMTSGELIHRFVGHDGPTRAVAFSPDGKTVLSGSFDQSLILWDVASGQALHRMSGHTANPTVLTFSPDGRYALSADLNGIVILWDLASQAMLRRYTGHFAGVLGLAFMPDMRSFLSASFDSTVREWRLDLTSEELSSWSTVNRYVPELTCEQRAQYHVEPLCDVASE